METADPFDLQRFVSAQTPIFATVLKELREGRKRSHWMWFVFPQLRGLGRSSIAQFYGIRSVEEARAFLAHVVLGPRLVLCTEHVLAIKGRTLSDIFGSPDDMKFRSSITLFALAVAEAESVFRQALQRFCDGSLDPETLALLQPRSQ